MNVCPDCGARLLHVSGEVVCGRCGLVVEERELDTGPDWRAYDQEQESARRRTGSPETLRLHDKGLSTTIDWRDRDSFGKALTPERRAQVIRLRRWQSRSRISDSLDRNLVHALNEMERMASVLALPKSVLESAAVIYRRVAENGLLRGRSIEGVAAASLYAACREQGVTRPLADVAEASGVKRKAVWSAYKQVARRLGIHPRSFSPADFVPQIASRAGLSARAQALALDILREAERRGLTAGRSPLANAAAALYGAALLLGENATQRELADASHLTEVTVRTVWGRLRRALVGPQQKKKKATVEDVTL